MTSTQERFKWTVLDEAPYVHQPSIASYWAKQAFPNASDEERDELVSQTLLELLDEELITFCWGSWDEPPDVARARLATRAEVEEDLAYPGATPARDRSVWFSATEKGLATLQALPPDAILRP